MATKGRPKWVPTLEQSSALTQLRHHSALHRTAKESWEESIELAIFLNIPAVHIAKAAGLTRFTISRRRKEAA
jgi:hypothetical protein